PSGVEGRGEVTRGVAHVHAVPQQQRSVRIERCAPQRGAGRDVVATESRVYRIIAATSVDGRVGIHRVGDVVIVGVAIADIERTVSIRIGVDLGGVRDA